MQHFQHLSLSFYSGFIKHSCPWWNLLCTPSVMIHHDHPKIKTPLNSRIDRNFISRILHTCRVIKHSNIYWCSLSVDLQLSLRNYMYISRGLKYTIHSVERFPHFVLWWSDLIHSFNTSIPLDYHSIILFM